MFAAFWIVSELLRKELEKKLSSHGHLRMLRHVLPKKEFRRIMALHSCTPLGCSKFQLWRPSYHCAVWTTAHGSGESHRALSLIPIALLFGDTTLLRANSCFQRHSAPQLCFKIFLLAFFGRCQLQLRFEMLVLYSLPVTTVVKTTASSIAAATEL